jgi:hypothetical protein
MVVQSTSTSSRRVRRWAIGGGVSLLVAAAAAVALAGGDAPKDGDKKPADNVMQFNRSEVVQPAAAARCRR